MLVGDWCRVGALYAYEEHIRALAAYYPQLWGVVYKADEAMRSTHWDHMRRAIAKAVERCKHEGRFNPLRPGKQSSETRWGRTSGGIATSAS